MRLAFYRAQMTRFFLCSALGIFFLAAPARAVKPAKPKKQAATAAKKPKEKAKASGRASPAERKGKPAARPTDAAPAERDTKTIDLISAHFPELAGADQAHQQEVAA